MTLAGAVGFSDDGHGVQSAGMMRTCMAYVSQFDRAVIAHSEVESLTKGGVVNEGRASTRLGMFGWPALGEELEIMRDVELCRLTGCPLHVAHISTARSLELVRQAKADGLPVTCEVTPHHLFLTEDDITDAYETNLKMNPPLRTPEDAAALREGIVDIHAIRERYFQSGRSRRGVRPYFRQSREFRCRILSRSRLISAMTLGSWDCSSSFWRHSLNAISTCR